VIPLRDPLAPAVADGVARTSSGEAAAWFALLRAEPDWPHRWRRARRKRQLRDEDGPLGAGR
jgi:hypothetical protein